MHSVILPQTPLASGVVGTRKESINKDLTISFRVIFAHNTTLGSGAVCPNLDVQPKAIHTRRTRPQRPNPHHRMKRLWASSANVDSQLFQYGRKHCGLQGFPPDGEPVILGISDKQKRKRLGAGSGGPELALGDPVPRCPNSVDVRSAGFQPLQQRPGGRRSHEGPCDGLSRTANLY